MPTAPIAMAELPSIEGLGFRPIRRDIVYVILT